MSDVTGKVIGTLLGAAAVTVLLGQIQKKEPEIIESFINVPIRAIGQTFYDGPDGPVQLRPDSALAQTLCNQQAAGSTIRGGDKLLKAAKSGDSAQFGASGQSGAGDGGISSDTGAGADVQLQFARLTSGPSGEATAAKDLQSTTKALPGLVGRGGGGGRAQTDNAMQIQTLTGGIEKYQPRREASRQRKNAMTGGRNKKAQGPRSPESMTTSEFNPKLASPFIENPPATSGTTNYYMGNQLMGADFQYPGGRNELLTPGVSITGTLPLGTMNIAAGEGGPPQNVFMGDRLVYSTLQRKRCAGTVDMIRGDLPIPVGGIISTPAGTPGDTLEPGAFATMFGIDAAQAQQTTALIAADRGAGYSNINAPLGDLVTDAWQRKRSGNAPEGLSMATFADTSAYAIEQGQRTLDQGTRAGTNNARVGVNNATGTIFGGTSSVV